LDETPWQSSQNQREREYDCGRGEQTQQDQVGREAPKRGAKQWWKPSADQNIQQRNHELLEKASWWIDKVLRAHSDAR